MACGHPARQGLAATLTPPYSRRAAAVRAAFADAGADGFLVTHPPNLRYLTGFGGSMGALLLLPDRALVIVDGRYFTAATSQVEGTPELAGVEVVLAERHLEEAVAVALGAVPLQRLGFEASAVTVSRLQRLSAAIAEGRARQGREDIRLVPLERVVERARLIKDPGEIATLREAARRLSQAARHALTAARVGRTEREVAAEIDATLREAGFDRPAFETIVASGPNSALPHARPGSRRLLPGDGTVLDFGGVYDGYCVDLTRSVQLPPTTEAYGHLLAAVGAAHAAAVAAVRPGVRASDVDRAARTVLTSHGLGDAFLHGTGHGLGLEVHEEPRIARAGTASPDEVLQPGMVFTIEPGAYVAGVGGARIEDDVLVVDQGCEVLTHVPIDRSDC